MTRWRPMLRWEACKERCEEGRRGGRQKEEEKRRREEKLSDEAVEKWGGGQHLKHHDKGKNRKRENLLCVWTIMYYVVFMCIFFILYCVYQHEIRVLLYNAN